MYQQFKFHISFNVCITNTYKSFFDCLADFYKYFNCRSMFILAPTFLVMFLLTGFTGLVVFTYYHTKGCDPLRAGYISNSNQV